MLQIKIKLFFTLNLILFSFFFFLAQSNSDKLDINKPVSINNIVLVSESNSVNFSGTSQGLSIGARYEFSIWGLGNQDSLGPIYFQIDTDGTWMINNLDLSDFTVGGNYRVEVIGPDSTGFSIGDYAQFSVQNNNVLKNNTIAEQKRIIIKSPVENNLKIVNGLSYEIQEVKVCALNGSIVSNTIEVSHLARGIYIVSLKTARGRTIHKIIKN